MKTPHTDPEQFASFYTEKNLGFDLKIIKKGFEVFRPYFKNGKGLELGPGNGAMTELLLEYFTDLTVVEGSKTLIESIPERSNLCKVNSLFEDFEPNSKFDTIIMNHVLEHIKDPIVLLKRIKSWMNEDAVLIIGVPNAKSFHRIAAVHMGLLVNEYSLNERDISLGHYRVYDFESLKNDVLEAGFKIIHEGGVFLKFLSNKQIEMFLNDKTVDAYFEIAPQFYQNAAEIYLILNK